MQSSSAVVVHVHHILVWLGSFPQFWITDFFFETLFFILEEADTPKEYIPLFNSYRIRIYFRALQFVILKLINIRKQTIKMCIQL